MDTKKSPIVTLTLDQLHAKTEPAPAPFLLARVVVWRDLGWACVFGGPDEHGLESRPSGEASAFWVNFALHAIADHDLGERPLYNRTCVSAGADQKTPHVHESEPTFRGFLREQGCMQWRASPGARFHVDDHEGLRKMHEALARVRDLAAAIEPTVETRSTAWREA